MAKEMTPEEIRAIVLKGVTLDIGYTWKEDKDSAVTEEERTLDFSGCTVEDAVTYAVKEILYHVVQPLHRKGAEVENPFMVPKASVKLRAKAKPPTDADVEAYFLKKYGDQGADMLKKLAERKQKEGTGKAV